MSLRRLGCLAAASSLLACAFSTAASLPRDVREDAADKPLVQPFWQASLVFDLPDGTTSVCETVASVPAGQRLVIEYVSALAKPPAGQHLRSSQLRTKVGQVLVFHGLLGQPTGVFNEYATAQLVRVYADPGTDVSYCADRDGAAGSMGVHVGLSGRWLPAAQP